MTTRQNVITILGSFIVFSSPAFAQSADRTDKQLSLGERYGNCTVVAQLTADHGSRPLLIDWAALVCTPAYKDSILNGQAMTALMNGDSMKVVDCLVCDGLSPEGPGFER